MVESDWFGVMGFFFFLMRQIKLISGTEGDEAGENEHGDVCSCSHQTLAGLFQRVETHYKMIRLFFSLSKEECAATMALFTASINDFFCAQQCI